MLSKTLLVFLGVYFLLDFSNGKENQVSFREDYSYIEALDSFYKIHWEPKNWRDAKRLCAEEDAGLFYPENSTEAEIVVSFWKKNVTQPDGWMFVGMSDIITEGVFETIDGKPISEVYNRWSPNQPDNSGDEDCVHLNQKQFINDVSCNAEYSFICKKSVHSEQDCSCNIQQSNSHEQRAKKFFRKDYTYVEEVENFYKIHTTPKSWDEANRLCNLEGATFFYPENVVEAMALLSFWKETKPIVESVWIGLSDIFVEGVFKTADGKPVSEVYTNWYGGEPNNSGDNEDCVTIDLTSKMNDYVCGVNLHFICKKSLKTLEWNNHCDMPNLDYTFSRDTGKCYKLHTTPLNWNEAYAMCILEQSNLAVISNKREADYLVNLTESTPTPRIKGKYQRGIYHVGFHNKLNEGWQTVKGTPLKVDDVKTWYDNSQPNTDEECGSMFYTGRLVNTVCAMKSFFICEHEVEK